MARYTIEDLLSERHKRFTPLQRLLRQAGNQAAWTAQVRALLPADLADHVSVASRHGEALTLHVGDAATGTKLRFHTPTLLDSLSGLADFQGVREIRIRVYPASGPPRARPPAG